MKQSGLQPTPPTDLQYFIVHGIQCLPLNGGLSLGVLALVGKEVGLDVGVGETIAVGSCQSSGSAQVDHQLTILVEHPESDLPTDVIVSLSSASSTVDAGQTADAGSTQSLTQETLLLGCSLQ